MLYDVSERSVQEWLAILSACHAAARLRRKTLRQLEVVRRRMKQRQRDAVAQVVAMIAQAQAGEQEKSEAGCAASALWLERVNTLRLPQWTTRDRSRRQDLQREL